MASTESFVGLLCVTRIPDITTVVYHQFSKTATQGGPLLGSALPEIFIIGVITVSFPDAVRSVLTKYAEFNGRSRRSELWWFVLANFIAGIIANTIDRAIGVQIIGGLLSLALLLPSLGVWARRLHDTGRSAFWLFLSLTGIGVIWLIVWACGDSQPGENKYGPSPKEHVAV
jgi:uncharacterized membrane protein YhaH (DUF805 family)